MIFVSPQLDKNVLDTMLCAGETNRDSCQGDSGGEPSLSMTILSHFDSVESLWATLNLLKNN